MAKKKAARRKTAARKPTGDRAAGQPKDEPILVEGELEKEGGYALNDDQIERDLITGERRDLLEAYFGEQAYDELQRLARKAQRAGVRGGPRVLILPGIMGSKLGWPRILFNNTIWFNPVQIARGRLQQLSLVHGDTAVEPLGVILTSYLMLKLRLKRAGFDADFHPYDWRQSIDQLGRQLAQRIQRETSQGTWSRGIYLVAHSMGGLVSRAALKRLHDDPRKVRRLVMLGTPHHGSFSPVQALRGTQLTIRRIAALDLGRTPEQIAEDVLSTFPGLHQMLPTPQRFTALNLHDPDSWPPSGPRLRPEVLRAAARIQDFLQPPNDRMSQIVGIGRNTVIDATVHGGEFIYRYNTDGDGTVPILSARLDALPAYFIAEDHGKLPNNGDVTRAVIDILERGRTNLLPTEWTPSRREVVREVSDRQLMQDPFEGRTGERISSRELRHMLDEFAAPVEPGEFSQETPGTSDVLAHSPVSAEVSSEPVVIGRRRQHRLDLRLAHGSISQVDSRAIVLGLFPGVTPTGPARAIDRQLDGLVSELTSRRMFSGQVGEIFVLPTGRHSLLAEMVIFAGLGLYDQLDNERLRLAADSVARTLVRTKVDDFATVLLGVGSGTGLEESLANLLAGFLRGLGDADVNRRVRSMTLCEMDDERYGQMRRELLRLAGTPLFDDVEVTYEEIPLPPEPLPVSTRAVSLDAPDPAYLIVRRIDGPQLETPFAIQASVLTAGGKATVVTDHKSINTTELRKHLDFIRSRNFRRRPLSEFGSKLADLVVPDLVAHMLKTMQDRHVVVIHDAEFSRIPWETICLDGWFPAADLGMGRRYEAENLSVAKWLEQRRLEDNLELLLIVDPTEDLEGARKEGDQIQELLGKHPSINIHELRGPAASWHAVKASLRSGTFDVVHYAGHAFFDPRDISKSGLICHDHHVLSGADLAGLEQLPALVFMNACESARVRRRGVSRDDKAPVDEVIEGNVGMAEAFLRGGVANFVGTYWPVGDAAAKVFADQFYAALVSGRSIGQAIREGRQQVRRNDPVDWANYMHYGSYGFVLKNRL